jgi:cytochrome c-type biogenesis protein CcmH
MMRELVTRRQFVGGLVFGAAGTVLGTRLARAQQGGAQVRTTMSGPMDNEAYHSVVRPPKPNAEPSMSAAQRDALEHDLHCQCGCTLDVYTCRTTDFTCSVSPSMHRDVMQMVAGGYSKAEILGAFREAYGERVLMAPVVEGFNRMAYVTPFIALGAAVVGVALLIRRWTAAARATIQSALATAPAGESATPSELAHIEAAIRDDSR